MFHWRHYLKTEAQMWRGLVGLIILMSLLSLGIEVLTADALGTGLLRWTGDWLSDFSSDLAGAILVIFFVRWWVKQAAQPEEVNFTPPPAETYFIDAKEIIPPFLVNEAEQLASQKTLRRANLLADLTTASSPDKRQDILLQLNELGGLVGLNLTEMDLQGVNLAGVNLRGANLSKAKLRGANLAKADLSHTNCYMTQLIEADLHGANLTAARLERTFLAGANLAGSLLHQAVIQTSLWRVNLQGSDLFEADLSGAELFHTNLLAAQLTQVRLVETKINSETILPDGRHWSPKTEMGVYLDPNHPRFWQKTSGAN